MICTNSSKNYIINDELVVKIPQKEDDDTMFIMNMIYERQIKRVMQFFYYPNHSINDIILFGNDLFVISASDPSVFLNYASGSIMNITLDDIIDPIELEYWIYIVLCYLAFMHRILHLVILDIKPSNIFIGRSRIAKESVV